jgi:hypothetical protein
VLLLLRLQLPLLLSSPLCLPHASKAAATEQSSDACGCCSSQEVQAQHFLVLLCLPLTCCLLLLLEL